MSQKSCKIVRERAWLRLHHLIEDLCLNANELAMKLIFRQKLDDISTLFPARQCETRS